MKCEQFVAETNLPKNLANLNLAPDLRSALRHLLLRRGRVQLQLQRDQSDVLWEVDHLTRKNLWRRDLSQRRDLSELNGAESPPVWGGFFRTFFSREEPLKLAPLRTAYPLKFTTDSGLLDGFIFPDTVDNILLRLVYFISNPYFRPCLIVFPKCVHCLKLSSHRRAPPRDQPIRKRRAEPLDSSNFKRRQMSETQRRPFKRSPAMR